MFGFYEASIFKPFFPNCAGGRRLPKREKFHPIRFQEVAGILHV